MLPEEQASRPDQSVRQKLDKMFSRYDYVGVKNILKTEFTWVVALERNEILGMLPGDQMNEERMAQSQGGSFLPGDSVSRQQQKVTKYVLKPGEKKMIIGEAAYVLIPRILNAYVRQEYGNSKSALAKLRNPVIHDEIVPKIAEGPIINNIGEAIQTYVNDKMEQVEGFTDVQTKPSNLPKGGEHYEPEVTKGGKAVAQNSSRA